MGRSNSSLHIFSLLVASQCPVQVTRKNYVERVPQFTLLYKGNKYIGACKHCYRITRLKD